MDSEFIIEPTGNLKVLKAQMEQWSYLSYSQKKRSDNKCKKIYGKTNMEFYDILKENIDKSENKDRVIKESVIISTNNIIDHLEAYEFEKSKGCVILAPWLEDNNPGSYTQEELQEKYIEYLNLDQSHKDMSNKESIKLFGKSVDEMKFELDDKFKNLTESDDIKRDSLKDHIDSITENDMCCPLHTCLAALDCLSVNDSIYESSVLENFAKDTLYYNHYTENYNDDVPLITPWFTPDEMMEQFNIQVNPYDYILNSGSIDSIRESMNNLFKDPNNEDLINKVIQLGWNPSVNVNESSLKQARDRQVLWLNDNKKVQLVDISDFEIHEDYLEEATRKKKSKISVVYITLLSHEGLNSKGIRMFTKSNYSHAGISFDEKMTEIFSFNAATPDGGSGLSIENINFYMKAKSPNFKVMAFFVDNKVKDKMIEVVRFYMKNKDKTNYSWANLFRMVINKTKDTAYSTSLVCSQFVDTVLKSVNVDITGKSSNLVFPGDFDRVQNARIYNVFVGKLKDYSPRSVRYKIMKLMETISPKNLITKPLKEAVECIYKEKTFDSIMSTDIHCDMHSNESVNYARAFLNASKDFVKPSSVIVEAANIPIRFDKKGDLYIDLPRDLEKEYQEAHRLLEVYNESNVEGIKHQLARLFFINSIIEKRIKYKKKDDEEYKKLINLRARVINDFNKYIKMVLKIEKDFDFEEYLKNSEYYNKTVVIDRHTMKYTGRLIKDMIGLMK